MVEGLYRRMVDLLQFTLQRINVEIEIDVAFYDFYENFKTCRITPEHHKLEHDEIESIKQVSHIPHASMRNKGDYREIICEIKNGHIENPQPNSKLTPLRIVFIRYPLSIYETIPNYQIWAPCDEWNPVFKYYTLLDFTLLEFLSECHDHFPNPNYELAIQRAGETYLSFMTPRMSENYRGQFIKDYKDSSNQKMKSIIDARNWMLHSDINLISFQKYEKQEIASEYTISSYDMIEKLELQVRFENPVPIKDYKTMRKLLEIANAKESMLVGTVSHAFGFISTDNADLWERNDIYQRPDFISVRFFGISDWEVSKLHKGEKISLMKSESFRYQYPKQRYSKDSLRTVLTKLPDCDIDTLINIVDSAIKEEHGTMLVISTSAKDEANRLADCCIGIEPTPYLSMKMNVTAIDGAVLCDPLGTCHAIGLILDGVHKSGNGETIARGARHNSAKRYSKWQNYTCVVIIVSEDGDVTIIPEN